MALPWELLRDPLTQAPLALSARAFVRTLPVTTRSPRLPEGESGPVRILLAICRPRGDRDVGFRSVASRLIKGLTEANRVPVLWIWDNVELVAGFPEGTESSWTRDEQAELLAFLRDLRPTQVKVLLTSRRDEHSWLGDLPTRIRVPPMREDESLLLVRALPPSAAAASSTSRTGARSSPSRKATR